MENKCVNQDPALFKWIHEETNLHTLYSYPNMELISKYGMDVIPFVRPYYSTSDIVLSRSVQFHRNFHFSHTVLSVSEIVRRLLFQLCGSDKLEEIDRCYETYKKLGRKGFKRKQVLESDQFTSYQEFRNENSMEEVLDVTEEYFSTKKEISKQNQRNNILSNLCNDYSKFFNDENKEKESSSSSSNKNMKNNNNNTIVEEEEEWDKDETIKLRIRKILEDEVRKKYDVTVAIHLFLYDNFEIHPQLDYLLELTKSEFLSPSYQGDTWSKGELFLCVVCLLITLGEIEFVKHELHKLPPQTKLLCMIGPKLSRSVGKKRFSEFWENNVVKKRRDEIICELMSILLHCDIRHAVSTSCGDISYSNPRVKDKAAMSISKLHPEKYRLGKYFHTFSEKKKDELIQERIWNNIMLFKKKEKITEFTIKRPRGKVEIEVTEKCASMIKMKDFEGLEKVYGIGVLSPMINYLEMNCFELDDEHYIFFRKLSNTIFCVDRDRKPCMHLQRFIGEQISLKVIIDIYRHLRQQQNCVLPKFLDIERDRGETGIWIRTSHDFVGPGYMLRTIIHSGENKTSNGSMKIPGLDFLERELRKGLIELDEYILKAGWDKKLWIRIMLLSSENTFRMYV